MSLMLETKDKDALGIAHDRAILAESWQLPCGCARFTGAAGERRAEPHGPYCGIRRRCVQSQMFMTYDVLERAWLRRVVFPRHY